MTLLEAGANVNVTTTHDQTAEEMARERGHTSIADLIRDYGSSGGLTKSAGKR